MSIYAPPNKTVLRRPLELAQYTAIRYTEKLTEVGALASIGSVGDSYDNALAETIVGLYKAECVNLEGPWRTIEELELATLLWVDWYNTTRLHSSIGYLTPAAFEQNYWQHQALETQTV